MRKNTSLNLRKIIALFFGPASANELEASEWEILVHVLREANLLAGFAYRAEAIGCLDLYPDYAQRHLRSMQTYSDRQAQQVTYECGMIARTLREVNVEPIFLKGAGYTLRQSLNANGRIYSDIDVLVPKQKIAAAQSALRKALWFPKKLKDYDERYYRNWAHEIPPMVHGVRRTVIDVHHNIVPPVSGRAPDMGIFTENLVTTEQGLKVLSPSAAALHSMVHLFTNEDFSHAFRDLVDLHLLIVEYGGKEFWDDLESQAKRTGFLKEVYYALESMGSLMNTDVPSDLKSELELKFSGWHTGLIQWLFENSIRPQHPEVMNWKSFLAIQVVYLRGHWIKMPATILMKHLLVKSWFSLRDVFFGKYQFEK